MKKRFCKCECGTEVEGLKRWMTEVGEPIHIIKVDGTQHYAYDDGTVEILTEDDPRYDHLHNK